MKTPAFWQSGNRTARWLAPAAKLYQWGAWLDRRFARPRHVPIPVISVGNVTAGGAGKTPATMALATILTSLGFKPHILTRGYGAASGRTPHRVDPETGDWRRVGDEALLLARSAPTWAGRDRHASALAAADEGATVALCDDALQHYRLARDLSLLVIDGPYGIGNGRLLPAGPLREPFETALMRCDAAILIGEDVHQFAPRLPFPVFHASFIPAVDTSFLMRGQWLAFAGIGRPEKFYATLREYGALLAGTHDFPDHHAYREKECRALLAEAERLGARLITTEKDAVKLPPDLRAQVHTLPVRLVFADTSAFMTFLRQRLTPHQPA